MSTKIKNGVRGIEKLVAERFFSKKDNEKISSDCSDNCASSVTPKPN